MRYLIDTHVLLWAAYDSRQLTSRVKDILNNENCSISIASLWEIAIKVSIGKLKIKQSVQDLAKFCLQCGMEIVEIAPIHCDIVIQLPSIHNDPFDRIIIATAKANGYTIVTKDGVIPRYDVNTVW